MSLRWRYRNNRRAARPAGIIDRSMDPWRTAIATSDATHIWIRGHAVTSLMRDGDVHRHDRAAPPRPAALAGRAPAARRDPHRRRGSRRGRPVVRRGAARRVRQPAVAFRRDCRGHPDDRRRPRRRRIELHGADRAGPGGRAARRPDAGGGGQAPVDEACAAKRRLPGLGHRVHTTSTPASPCCSTWRGRRRRPATASLFMEALEAAGAPRRSSRCR